MNLGISALNYVNAIKNNEFTVEEFISESLDHINQVDEKLHAFLRINDSAIKNAKDIDAKIKYLILNKRGLCSFMFTASIFLLVVIKRSVL